MGVGCGAVGAGGAARRAPPRTPSTPSNPPPCFQASREAMRRLQDLIAEVEARQRARARAVPTKDAHCRALLRQLREPVTLFGEREARGSGRGWKGG